MNGVATSFLSAGEQEIAEYDAAGALVRRFVWGAGLDDLVATIGTTGSTAARRRLHQAGGPGSAVAVTLVRARAYAAAVARMARRLAQTATFERRLDAMVIAAYGRTPQDVARPWRTARPRLPIPPPDPA